MRKIALYIILALALFSSCKGHEWDTQEELTELSISWASQYVEKPLSRRIYPNDTIEASYETDCIVTSQLKDSLVSEFVYRYNNTDGDSVNVISKFLQVRDSIVVTVNGYRYSKKLWAHVFTADSGIINFEGKFQIDFYEIGKTDPWAKSEITYHKDTVDFFYYKTDKPVISWY